MHHVCLSGDYYHIWSSICGFLVKCSRIKGLGLKLEDMVIAFLARDSSVRCLGVRFDMYLDVDLGDVQRYVVEVVSWVLQLRRTYVQMFVMDPLNAC